MVLAVSSGLAAALAGCASLSDDDVQQEVQYPPASVSGGKWKAVDKSATRIKQSGLEGVAAMRTYRNTRLQQKTKENFFGKLSTPLALGFAARIEYKGLTATAVRTSDIYQEAKPKFESRLRNRGVTSISEVDSNRNPRWVKPDIGQFDKYTEYNGEFPVAKQRVSLTLDGYGQNSFVFKKKSLPVRMVLVASDETIGGGAGHAWVVGGSHPRENYENEATTTLTKEGDASVKLTVSVDTGLHMPKIRRELVNQFINPILNRG